MSTVPRHDVVVKRAGIAKARAARLSSYVGGAYTYTGRTDDEKARRAALLAPPPGKKKASVANAEKAEKLEELYPRRIGQRCAVIFYNRDEAHAPLVVQWRDGARGIAEPEWLREIAQ